MRHKSPKLMQFLFLELLDPEINGLLCGLRAAFSDEERHTNIHITVRGPYNKTISREKLKTFSAMPGNQPLLIHGIGMFENQGNYVVYIRVWSKWLNRLWWKPDYPIEEYGFNPHISLYIGSDRILAEKIEDFLKKEGLKLLCRDFRITPFTSRQTGMFPLDPLPIEHNFPKLSYHRLVRPDIIQRAESIFYAHHKPQLESHSIQSN